MPEPRVLAGPEAIAAAVRELAAGGLAAFPTETVYGLGADALRADAVAKVFALKGRPPTNPLIVHVSGTDMARRVVDAWPEEAEHLAGAFWPGPLTLVLPRRAGLPDAVTAGGPTVGVRCPDHPVALALIEASGIPLVGPSANRSGRLSPTTAGHVAEAFAGTDLLVVDGGACRAGIESTVLDLSGPTARILRPGVIGASALSAVLGRAVEPAGRGTPEPADGPAASPGLVGPHYQPATPVRLIERAAGSGVDADEALIAWSVRDHPSGGPLLEVPAEPAGYARVLYALLHAADALGVRAIVVEIPAQVDAASADPDAAAVRDAILERLGRAAHA